MPDHRWHNSGPETVAPGLHRIPLPLPDDGLRAVNTYAIEDHDGLVLVDPGQYGDDTMHQLDEGLRTLGLRLEHVIRCLTTHIHRDHYTNAVALRRRFGAPVSLGQQEQTSLTRLGGPDHNTIRTQLQMLPQCGAKFLTAELGTPGGEPPADIWEEPSEWLADDQRVHLQTRTLEVSHTPGHTRGHVVFRDTEAGLLLTGDHVLPHITPSIGFEPAPGELPLAEFLSSLQRLLDQPDATLLPAHGPAAASVHDRSIQLLAHHRERLAQTADQVAAGAHCPFTVASRLRWTRRERELSELDPYNMMLAVLETKAHLDVLTDRAALDKENRDGQLHYRARHT